MAKDLCAEIEKIDKKLDKLNSKRFPPIIYETYVEYRLSKLGEQRASLCEKLDAQNEVKQEVQERV